MNYTVLYETWQMQCCGEPFRIGDEIEWLVIESPEDLRVPEGVTVDYYYDAHDDNWERISVITGTVTGIDVLYEKFVDGESAADKSIKAESVDGYEQELGDYSATAYMVQLADISIRKAKREEVTFK